MLVTGKSNFMDAISFVMGEKTSSLRVKRLSDLIHGASIGQPVSRTASVTAIITLENGPEKKFTRIVHGSSSEYRINGDVRLGFVVFLILMELKSSVSLWLWEG